jgi:RNA polymerase sigma-70 factor (ECF subfamily)
MRTPDTISVLDETSAPQTALLERPTAARRPRRTTTRNVVEEMPPENGYDRQEEYLLLKRFSEGDEQAFSQLYDRYVQKLLYYVHRCVNDWQVAEDIVQEVFIQVMRDAKSFEPRAALSTWIYRIATFMCLKHRRDTGLRHKIITREAKAGTFTRQNPIPGASEELEQSEAAAALSELVQKLPEKHKKVVQLREFADMSYEEIAKAVGIGIGTVKSRLFRARSMLREGLLSMGLV